MKQNEDYILDALFSQRYYYNLANKLESANLILIFVACILGSIAINNLLYQIIVKRLAWIKKQQLPGQHWYWCF